jgi:hypothetical protein
MEMSPTVTAAMRELSSASWDVYREAVELGIAALVRPSIPILFFGDDERYVSSPLKVITVGLNPSRLEFPRGDPFLRFPAARHIDPRQPALDAHLAALRAYFRVRPYNAWFRPAFEPILNGLAASYYDGAATNTALHTDICSPLATDPTWSRLGEVGAALTTVGVELWHRLTERLAPDVILISVAREHLDKILFPRLGVWEKVHTIARKNPFTVQALRLEVVPQKPTLLVFGRAANLPFGTVSADDKRTIGAAIGSALDA